MISIVVGETSKRERVHAVNDSVPVLGFDANGITALALCGKTVTAHPNELFVDSTGMRCRSCARIAKYFRGSK